MGSNDGDSDERPVHSVTVPALDADLGVASASQ